MYLEEARNKLNRIAGIKFSDIFSEEQMEMIIKNKGKTGQLLELTLGLNLSSSNMDFADGELKSNKCDSNGKPLETVFIKQISSMIDDLIQQKEFKETELYSKISNILYVPVCKVGNPNNWMFLPSIHIDLNEPKYASLYSIWENDYYSICKQLVEHIENGRDGYIHTSNGRHIQVRSKDSKNNGKYHPIYSNTYGRYISNKNYAFYFKKEFVYDIQNLN
ncbi:MAG TPA: DNA mismatch repair protein MutH [Lachnospiraceae bacterium]|nr:DNA mismatch repair protein MutH [Lachnospiraceae bacterium]